MCGRFSLVTSKEKLQFQLPFIEIKETLELSYNIAPTQHAYVVANDQPGKLQLMTWGLIPHWSPDGKNSGKLINARSEGITTKPSFRIPIRKRRCLVPADSFYEWRREGTVKLPYRILLKNGQLMMFAGIWDLWLKDDLKFKTFSILTTEPNREMKTLHNRMPVLLNSEKEQEKWLAAEELNDVLDLLVIPRDDILTMHRVSASLNKVTNNFPELHHEIPETPTLF